jgi:hypothetical protein
MSAAAKVQTLPENVSAATGLPASRRVARDFAVLLGIALGSGVIAAIGMMLTVLLLS